MKIVFASDHGGYDLKEKLEEHYKEEGYKIIDVGTDGRESCDYPDYASLAAEKYFSEKADLIMLFCGTGIGMSISANKIKGIYCALLYDIRTARLAKSHNNVNCIALGGRSLTYEVAVEIVDTFIATDANMSDRHKRRREKVCDIEKR